MKVGLGKTLPRQSRFELDVVQRLIYTLKRTAIDDPSRDEGSITRSPVPANAYQAQ